MAELIKQRVLTGGVQKVIDTDHAYTKEEADNRFVDTEEAKVFAKKTEVPKKTSELENDSDYMATTDWVEGVDTIANSGLLTKGGEIISRGSFTRVGSPFFLMVCPKAPTNLNTTILNVKLKGQPEDCDFPFTLDVWNCAVLEKVVVTQELLEDYRFFWGAVK